MPIAHLRQNKPFPLLYLGHAQIISAALTGTCIFADAVTFINKDCRVLFEDFFIVPFLGPALGWTAMCSPGWENLIAIDWNDLPYLHPPPLRRLYIDRCISSQLFFFLVH